jgi:hypothetical protein
MPEVLWETIVIGLLSSRCLYWRYYGVLAKCEKNMKTYDERFPRCSNYKSNCLIHYAYSYDRYREDLAHFVTRSFVEVTRMIRLIIFKFDVYQLFKMNLSSFEIIIHVLYFVPKHSLQFELMLSSFLFDVIIDTWDIPLYYGIKDFLCEAIDSVWFKKLVTFLKKQRIYFVWGKSSRCCVSIKCVRLSSLNYGK